MKQKGIDSRSDKSTTPRKFDRKEESPEWVKNLSRYENPNLGLAMEQLVGTFIPYFLLLSLMLVSHQTGRLLLGHLRAGGNGRSLLYPDLYFFP